MNHTNDAPKPENDAGREQQDVEQRPEQTAEPPRDEDREPAQEHAGEPDAAPDSQSASDSDEGRESGMDPQALEYKQLAEEHYQRLLRLQADYDNFRRRTRLEKEDFAKYASLQLIEKLLPVYDNFDRALAAGKESKDLDSFLKGVDMIFRQFAGVLESEGLKPIEAVGRPFNPEYHQAVMQVETDEAESGIVVEELQKGYMLKEKVIRPSMVKVNS